MRNLNGISNSEFCRFFESRNNASDAGRNLLLFLSEKLSFQIESYKRITRNYSTDYFFPYYLKILKDKKLF